MLDLDMAQYAPFVWSAWGISAAVLAAMVVGVLRRAGKAARALRDAEGDDAA
jgi:heme exporter protein D